MNKQLLFRKSQLFNNNAAILFILWFAAAVCDCLWLILDGSIPSWDQSDHLTRSLNYWRVLQHPQIFSSEWWHQLWQQSPTYRGPFVYLVTVPFFNIFGRGYHQAILVNLLFTAILLLSVYKLGKHLFTPQVGLWAAGLCLLFPSLVFLRIDYLLDYGITTVVIFTFASLTWWRDARTRRQSWLWSISFGLGFGLVMLAKPTGLLFFLVPGFWLLGETLLKRNWERLLQLGIALGLTWLICGSWYRANWLIIITSAVAANAVGKSHGHPGPNTIAGWLHYGKILPDMLSWPLLLVPLGCWVLAFGFWVRGKKQIIESNLQLNNPKSGWGWLAAFCLGVYILCSLGTNKDVRFIAPYVPVIALILARGLTIWSSRWGQWLRWGTVAVACVLLVFNLFPVPGAHKLGWGRHLAYLGKPWHHSEAIAEVVRTAPYLRSNIGVIPVYTPEMNPFNIDYYGNLADFQVYGRQLAFSVKQSPQNVRSLVWYLTKTGEPRNDKSQKALQTAIEQSPDLQLQRTWLLPDGNQLKLYHRRIPPVTVEPITQSLDKVKLEAVTVPTQALPGKPVPVTYQFSGPWKQLQEGLVLLTWQGETGKWLHDGGIGLGQLYAGAKPPLPTQGFRVVERLAMLPSAQTGTYTLKAVYLNRKTGTTYPLDVPPVQITLNPKASPAPAPELDLITKLQQLGSDLSKGKLDLVFKEIAPLNQYDPIQDYLLQEEEALTYRIQIEPNNLDLAYTLALTQVLQRQVQPLLKTLEKIVQLDATNPYAWTYLGFIHLYNLQPQAAEKALNIAQTLNPTVREVKLLKAVASVMKLNLPQAWERFHRLHN